MYRRKLKLYRGQPIQYGIRLARVYDWDTPKGWRAELLLRRWLVRWDS